MAYCLNEAVWYFGSVVRDRMQEAGKEMGKNDNEAKRRGRMENSLRASLGQPKRFASMSGMTPTKKG